MKQLTLLLLAAMSFATAQSQKLPNKQELSCKAPTRIKIDGKNTEWGDFKAYNSATGLFYTLANDEKNLYLIIRTVDRRIMDKLFGGGISLFFNSADNNDKKLRGEINYLALSKVNRLAIAAAMKDTVNKDLINSTMAPALKTIGVKNLNDVGEELVSVYNEYGIMAASYLSNMDTYTCEIAIPLKHLKSFVNNKGIISYTLQANAQSLNNLKVVMNGKEVENAAASQQLTDMLSTISQSEKGAAFREMLNDTNVSGEYALAK